jgi:glutaredoxin-like protein
MENQMEKLLNDDIRNQILDIFADFQDPVQILFFGKKDDCDYCDDTLQLVSEVAELSDKVQLMEYDLVENADVAAEYNVDMTPGLVIAASDGDEIIDYGIRFAGIPSGHEFSTLVNDLVMVSTRDSGLNQKTRDYLSTLTEPVRFQVFVTPTCPYCPRAVVLAHKMALESDMVQAEMVEATQFPQLSQELGISGVPNTYINRDGFVLGAVPEGKMVEELERLFGKN